MFSRTGKFPVSETKYGKIQHCELLTLVPNIQCLSTSAGVLQLPTNVTCNGVKKLLTVRSVIQLTVNLTRATKRSYLRRKISQILLIWFKLVKNTDYFDSCISIVNSVIIWLEMQ